MQVLFGADNTMGSLKSLVRKTKNFAKKTGSNTARVGAKTIRATAPLAPAIAFIPGVGTAIASGLVASKAGLDATAKARKVVSNSKGLVTASRSAITNAVHNVSRYPLTKQSSNTAWDSIVKKIPVLSPNTSAPIIPDMPENKTSETPVPSGNKNMLIIGAVTIGALLLMGKKRK